MMYFEMRRAEWHRSSCPRHPGQVHAGFDQEDDMRTAPAIERMSLSVRNIPA